MTAKKAVRPMTFIGLLLVLSAAAFAQEVLQIEPAQSEIHFTLPDVLHTVKGTFQVSQGKLQLQRQSDEMTGIIAVGAASGQSGNDSRDNRMKGSELHAQSYPQITFQPQRYTGTLNASGRSSINVTGILTLLGTGHSISVPMQGRSNGRSLLGHRNLPSPICVLGTEGPQHLRPARGQRNSD
jgi:polyisoprenoid-binding protein YceI